MNKTSLPVPGENFAVDLIRFAEEVGPVEPVSCIGGRTNTHLGGTADPAAREVRAPAGIREVNPQEMLVRVAAGTKVAELHAALSETNQRVGLRPDFSTHATVGGALAVGLGGIHALRLGPPRDAVMEVTYVSSAGELSKSGGPVVKNVSGFDLCRLLVGSFGTLGFLGEVVLRCSPQPAVSQWFVRFEPQPGITANTIDQIHAPGALLTTETAEYVLLEGHAADVATDRRALKAQGFEECVAGPELLEKRVGTRRGNEVALGHQSGLRFVACVGTGVLTVQDSTTSIPAPPSEAASIETALTETALTETALAETAFTASITPAAAQLNRMVKKQFDPTGRMNPGRDVLAGIEERTQSR